MSFLSPSLVSSNPLRLSARQYGLQPSAMSPAAYKVVKTLQEAGFSAYVVGGAVRDALMGKQPKDFDVATNARPEEIRRLFRRSRIIGKRFQIVHVLIRQELIEVTTFRGEAGSTCNELGRIMRDNVFGRIDEDARRRDYTCNALYYDPITDEILDFHQGVADLQKKRLVMIGEPKRRLVEDPVRVLRALRLAAKLNLTMSQDLCQALDDAVPLLIHEPAARLFDEMMKVCRSGYALAIIKKIQESTIQLPQNSIFSLLTESSEPDSAFTEAVLTATDLRVRQDLPMSVSFVLAALLWQKVKQAWEQYQLQGEKSMAAMTSATTAVFNQPYCKGIPHKISAMMRDVWQFQAAFPLIAGKRPMRLMRQSGFRMAYDFYALRVAVGDADKALLDWWQAFLAADDAARFSLIKVWQERQRPNSTSKGTNKKRRRKKNIKLDGEVVHE